MKEFYHELFHIRKIITITSPEDLKKARLRNISGVYSIYFGEFLVYVGSSINLYSRLLLYFHTPPSERHQQLLRYLIKIFTAYNTASLTIEVALVRKSEISAFEIHKIITEKPIFNKQY